MAFQRGDWPLTPEQVLTVIGNGETRLVELKRDWPDMQQAEGKATVVRNILALANAVGPNELALLIFGVDDERHGGRLHGVAIPPVAESLSQILNHYTQPPVQLECKHYTLHDVVISVVAVMHSHNRPHYSFREHPQVLNSSLVYVRRDKQVGIMTPPEVERLVREKVLALSAPVVAEPVEFGFLEMPSGIPAVFTVRVRNLTAVPLTDVWVIFDVADARDSGVRYRMRSLNNASLAPGEAREVSVRSTQFQFYKIQWNGNPPGRTFISAETRNHVGDGWLDVRALLSFRAEGGLLAHREVLLRVDVG